MTVDNLSSFRYDTMKILEVFSGTPLIAELGVKPSFYVNELLMSTSERQNYLLQNNECIRLFPNAPPSSIFNKWDIKPRIIFFNNCQPGNQYEACFTVRNKYRSSKMLKMKMERSEVFELEELVQMRRLASMVTARYKVKFRPQEMADYQHIITLRGENESFPIYILAIGPRPIIDFPDRIDFGEILVNYNNEKTIPLKNISQISATVVFHTVGLAIVEEEKLTLAPGEDYNFNLKLYTKCLGYINAQVIATYESGERVYINVTADCKRGKIYLEESAVQLEETYLGLISKFTLTLHNDTDHVVNFSWLRNKDLDLDHNVWKRLCNDLKKLNEVSKCKLAGLKYLGVANEKEHESALNRAFGDEISEFRHKFYFIDGSFDISPSTGTVWPRSIMQFHITFKPTEVITYMTIAYLEVTGLENRIKVPIQGEALGPKISLNVNTIDFGRCFICSIHRYGILARNIGIIKGTLKHIPEPLMLKGEVKCNPAIVELFPDESKLIEISVNSTVPGSFFEDVWFEILESSEKIRCTLQGEIINPRIILNKNKLDFGEVALGFPNIQTFLIKNDSPIAVDISIRIEGDGYMPAAIIDYDYDNLLPSDPQEFMINPHKTTISSGEVISVEVKLVSNIMRKHRTKCSIYFWNVLLDECSLVVTYESKAPTLCAKPSEILMRYAFTDYEYLKKITISNNSDLPTFFSVVPQQDVFNPYIIFRLENSSGFLAGKSCQLVKIYIKVLSLNPCKERIKMKVFGMPYLVNACTIKAYGMGPVVNPSSYSLNWGKIPVLTESEKTFQLINVSPITAYYRISVVKHPDVWEVRNPEGHIPADESIEMVVIAKLKDSGKIKDQIWVEIAGSRDLYISLSACGYGISIVTEPNLFPFYDIGKVFRKEKHTQTIKVTNVGTRDHTLLFTTMKEIKKMTKMKAAQEQGLHFKITPYRLNLAGGESKEMEITYKCDDEAVLEDTYYCYAIINNQGKRIVLGTCTIKATFTDPEFYAEPPEVHFRVDISHFDKEIGPLHQKLKLTSLWGSKLSVECKLNRPFSFGGNTLSKRKTSQYLELEPNSEHQLLIVFDPPNLKTRLTKVCNDAVEINYKGHTVKTYINVIGEVNFPNLTIEMKNIDFGCVVPYSEGVIQVQMKNLSPLVVDFDWFWEDSCITPLKQVPGYTPRSKTDTEEVIIHPPLYGSCSPRETSEYLLYDIPASCSEIDVCRNLPTPKKSTLHKINFISKMIMLEDMNLPQNLPSLISNLMARKKYFYRRKHRSESFALEPELKIKVWVDYETQFTGRIAFYASRISKFDENVELSAGTFCESSNSLRSTGQSYEMDMSGSKESPSTISQDPSISELLPMESANTSFFKSHQELKTIPQLEPETEGEIVPIISKIIDINPCEDILEPQHSMMATFTFSPRMPMLIEGTAVCRVLGGPEETIEIKAISFPIQYEVLPEKINFGFGPPCELWCSSLMVWNKSLKEVKVSVCPKPTTTLALKEEEDLSRLPKSVSIYPPTITLKPFQVSYHRVAIFPGRVGDIEQPLLVQVDNEEPVHLDFVGFSTPHQIHLKIPHTIRNENDLEMYETIARMTSSWFQLDIKDQLDIDISSGSLENILTEIKGFYAAAEDDWDFLMTKDDLVPSIDDINMAYERFLCEKYIARLHCPLLNHIPNKIGFHTLPGFILPRNTADFGVVIAGTKALYAIPYTNYSPLKTLVHIIPPEEKKLLDKYGVVFKLVPAQHLVGYEEKCFEIFIRPPRDILHKVDEASMAFDFYFTVTCGGTVPVTVKALITKPSLEAPGLLDFEGVKMGYRRIKKFKLKNVSKVDCEWFAVLIPPNKLAYDSWKGNKMKKCPFVVFPVHGYLSPKHITVISVIFEPNQEAPYEIDIRFVANMNPSHICVRLRGYGIEPKLLIREVSFGYTIPFSKPLKKHLTVYNPTLAPLEIFIHKKDKEQAMEQTIFKLLLDYYGDKKICVPSSFYSTRMTEGLRNMYRRLADKAIRKYIEDTASYLNIVIRRQFGKSRISSDLNMLSRKQSKRNLKKFANKKLSMIIPNTMKKTILRKAEEYKQKVAAIEEIIWEYLPTKSLSNVIQDYIDFVKYFNYPRSNLASEDLLNLTVFKENVVKEGNIIILHCSPKTHPGLFCWLMNKHTGMVPVSVDKEIYAELKEAVTEESLIARDMLYNYYLQERSKPKADKSRGSLLSITKSNTLKSLKELIQFASSKFKTKKGTEAKQKQSRESAGGQKFVKSFKSAEKVVDLPPTLINIPKTYFQSILQRRLNKKIKDGIIIKSLSSKFFSSPLVTLEILVNIFRDFSNLNVVSLFSTVEMCMKLDRDLLNLNLIEEFQRFTGKSILDASPSFILKVGKEIYDQRRALSKLGFLDSKKIGSRSVRGSIRSPKLTTTQTTSKLTIKKSKPKLATNPMVIEAEEQFSVYYKELEGIRAFLDNIDRTKDYSKEDIAQHPKVIKKSAFQRSALLSMPKVQPEVNESVGVPLWILNHYPYPGEYQFSAYTRLFASLESVYKKPSTCDVLAKKKKQIMLSGKSYFTIDKIPEVEACNDDNSDFEEDPIFRLKPISTIKYKKIKPLESLTEEEHEESPTLNAYSTVNAAFSTSTITASSGNALGSSVGIDSLMYSIMLNNLESVEANLMAELESFFDPYERNKNSNRQLVKPSRFKSWEVHFSPVGCCDYNEQVSFGISGCKAVKTINIFGGCDIPDISFVPADMFSKIQEESELLDLHEIINPCYLTKRNAFHFGSVIVHNNAKNWCFSCKASLTFKNNSNIPVNMTICIINEKRNLDRPDSEKYERQRSFFRNKSASRLLKTHKKESAHMRPASVAQSSSMRSSNPRGKGSKVSKDGRALTEDLLSMELNSHDSKKKKIAFPVQYNRSFINEPKCFVVETSNLHIKAGQAETLNISSQPIKIGLWSSRYLFSIENNPKVYALQTYCCGISVHMTFHPKELQFDEVILYRSSTICFSMENTSKKPLAWKVYSICSLLPQVSVSKQEGCIKPGERDTVYVTYSAKEVEKITKDLTVGIYAQENKELELQQHTYHLTLKSYSVDVNFYFELSGNDHLVLGDVGARWDFSTLIIIENKGVNPVMYCITVDEHRIKYLKDALIISMDNVYGSLRSEEICTSKLQIYCSGEITLSKEPLLFINIADYITEELIAKIPGYISLQSHFAKFILSPTQTLDFGDIEIGTLKILELTLENSGSIDFNYRISYSPGFTDTLLSLESLINDSNTYKRKNSEVKQFQLRKNSHRMNDHTYRAVRNSIEDLLFLKKTLFHQEWNFMRQKVSQMLKIPIANCSVKEMRRFFSRHNKINLLFKIKNRRKTLSNLIRETFKGNMKNFKQLKNIPLPKLKSEVKISRSTKYYKSRSNPNYSDHGSTVFDGFFSLQLSKGHRSCSPPFQIDPAEGLIKREESKIINVYCFPQTEGSFEKTFSLKVKNASLESTPVPLSLRVKCSVPKINFDDYDSIFREFEIVDTVQFNKSNQVINEGFPYKLFSRSNKTMYFFNAIVGSSAVFHLYFRSENHFPASVAISIIGDNENTFTINDSEDGIFFISPYECSSVPITFSPKSLSNYEAAVNIELKTQSNFEIDRVLFSISGSGNMPIIELNKVSNAGENYSFYPKLDFGFVHVDTSEILPFTIKNVGFVIAEVLLELTTKPGVFLLHCTNDALEAALNEPLFNGDLKPSAHFRIKPEHEITFKVEFHPMERGTYSSTLCVHIVYNPFEMSTLKLFGEAYLSYVVLRGPNISIVPPNYLLPFPNRMDDFMEYNLNFGLCVARKKYTQRFMMINNSSYSIRFEYDFSSQFLVCIPSVGHIYQSSMKEIQVILLATTPENMSIDLTCNFEGIAYKEETAPSQQWDNSVKMISWLEEEKLSLDISQEFYLSRAAAVAQEPEYYSTSSNESHIVIHCSAIVDVPSFIISPRNINFPNVLVGQIMEQCIEIKNESHVDVRYEMSFKDEIYSDSDTIPDIVNFTFGKFNYNLNNLPEFTEDSLKINVDTYWPSLFPNEMQDNLDYSMHELFKESEYNKNGDKWEILKMKHLSIIYEKPVLELSDPLSSESTSLKESTIIQVSPPVSPKSKDKTTHAKNVIKGASHMESNLEKIKHNFAKLVDVGSVMDDSAEQHSQITNSPFSADLVRGIIKREESIKCKVSFLPRHIQTYQTSLRFLCKDTNEENLIDVKGTGILPLCHVEIDETDYLKQRGSLFPTIPGNTKAVVIECMDFDVVINKTFNVYNITEIPYHFKWYCLKQFSKECKLRCYTLEGVIPPRGTAQMVFSFYPVEYGTFESLWVFCIKEFLLQQTFLFAGVSREPKVDVDSKIIILKPSLKGMKTSSTVKLVNYDDLELQFSICKESVLSCVNCNEVLQVSPMKGKIKPNGYSLLNIEFVPHIMKEQMFNLLIKICSSKKIIPLKIISKSFSIVPEVFCLKEDFEKIILQASENNYYNVISLGKVNVKIPYTLSFTVRNIGDISLYFECFLPNEIDERISIDIKRKQGIIAPSKEITFFVKITALQKVSFNQPLIIKVAKGPDYCMNLTGNAVTPVCRFSFESYDFGMCLIQDYDPLENSVVLEFLNLDTDPVLVETEGCKDGFYVNFKSLIVEPRAVHKILITFNPIEPKKYYEILKFSLNNYSENEIILSGEGVPFLLEIENPDNRLVDFGPVTAGKIVSKYVPIINRSQTRIEFSLHARERNEEKSNAKLFLEPFDKKIRLSSGAVCNVKVSFYATEKLKTYSCTVSYRAYGMKGVLFLVKASVIDYELSLDQTYLLFGPTTIGCSSTMKVGLINSGDIGTRFKLMTEVVSEVFVIKPLEGYSPPGSTTIIEVTFIPNNIMQYYNNVLVCSVENYCSLTLGMTGVCVKLPLPLATIKYVTKVRQEIKEDILLHNRTFVEQIIHPIIEGEYFSGADTVIIPPQESILYEISYNPQTETKNRHHLGSLFCPYNNGEGQLYKLMGTALPPKYKNTLTWDCYARVKKYGKIPVRNWTTSSETFAVSVVCIDEFPPAYYEIEADDIICIPPKQKRNYSLGVLTFKQCTMHLKLLLKNIKTGEYNKYRINIISEPAPLPEPVKITSYARERVFYRIPIYNPKDRSVVFTFSSPHPDIKPKKKMIKVRPHKKAYLKLQYLPLRKGFYESIKIEICNFLLGRIVKVLNLEAYAARLEQETVVKTNLGVQERFFITIRNPTTYLITCFPYANSLDLTFPQTSFNIASGRAIKAEVFYLPSLLGTHSMKISVKTNQIGTLCFPVKGICHPPKPQGPFLIPKNGTFKLTFQNVLRDMTHFFCEVNSPEFQTTVNSFSLQPGQVENIAVEFVKILQSSELLNRQMSSCKLDIRCSTKENSVIHWIYYLIGEIY